MKKTIVGILILLMVAIFIFQKLQKPTTTLKQSTKTETPQEVGISLPEISTDNYEVIIKENEKSQSIQNTMPIINPPIHPIAQTSGITTIDKECDIKDINDILRDYGKLWKYEGDEKETKGSESAFSSSESEMIGKNIVLYYTCRSLAANTFEKALEKYDNLNDDYKIFYLQTKYSTLKRGDISLCQEEIGRINAFKNDSPALKNNICSSYCGKDLNSKCGKLLSIGFEQKDCRTTYPQSINDCNIDPDNKFWCLTTFHLENLVSGKAPACPPSVSGVSGINFLCGAATTKNTSFCEEIGKQLIDWYCSRKKELKGFDEIQKELKKRREIDKAIIRKLMENSQQ